MVNIFKIFVFAFSISLFANDLDFSLFKKGDNSDFTMLIIGGIQGDEPGGFNSANFIATKYEITKGNVWVVPNLNVKSIIANSRGIYGDMNRKFLHIDKSDPEYKIIRRIKSIILDKKVDVVLNLHDGSGFYRDTKIDDLKNPKRWGQCTIIDQKNLDGVKFGNLEEIANRVVKKVNNNLYDKNHQFHLKNTNTLTDDKEMEKALTYFVIKNSKPAFAIEASKTLPTNLRVFYHLNAIEEYMNIFGVKFNRNFDLTPKNIATLLYKDTYLNIFDSKVIFDLSNIKKYLKYVPLKSDKKLKFKSNNPLVNVVNGGSFYRVYIGNILVTELYPQYFSYDYSINSILVKVDGKEKSVKFGEILKVKDNFLVKSKDGYRVNIIGFTKRGLKNEANIKISKRNFIKRFSIDKSSNIYRVEVYRGDKFSGMFLVDFGG